MRIKKNGRPPLKKEERRDKRVYFYLNKDEYEHYEKIKKELKDNDLAINDILRKFINRFDISFLEFLELSPLDGFKKDLKLKGIYKNIFDEM